METPGSVSTSSVAASLANAGGCQAGAAQLAPLEAEVQASPARNALSRPLLPPPPHVQQDFNWDCGLACVLMVLRGLGAPERFNMDTMRHMCPEQSVWTVDLAHLLHRCGLAVTFCTLTLGANPDYAEEAFYRGCMVADVERVNSLFAQAAELGISVQRRSVSLGELRALVSTGQHVAILLVDKHKMDGRDGDFLGHYVVVFGYEAGDSAFLVRDPASSMALDRISDARLEAARRSFGTDEDCLLVPTSMPPSWEADLAS